MEKVDTHGIHWDYLLDMNNAQCMISYSFQDGKILTRRINNVERAKMLKLVPKEWYVFFIH